jgi:type II secretory pathway pseudopilin PulG
MRKNAFTLVELLIIMAILAILTVMMTGILDPMALINRGGDAKRKKDINRIKIALEEYMSDKGTLPTDLTEPTLLELNNSSNCGSDIFSPWLAPWPCDPSGGAYKIATDTEENPPSWFVVLTKLKNRNDDQIPEAWANYEEGTYMVKGGYSNAEVNFGVSSSNIVWYDRDLSGCFNPSPLVDKQCYEADMGDEGSCQESNDGYFCSRSDNCYLDGNCSLECKVSYCQVFDDGTIDYR